MEKNILDFIEHHVGVVRDLDRAAALARWEMLISEDADAKRRWEEKRDELTAVYRDREHFARVRAYDDDSAGRDPMLRRQLRRLRLRYAGYQVPEAARGRLTESADDIGRRARTWRVDLDGESVPLSDVLRTLEESLDVAARRRAWEAAMTFGDAIGPEFVRLVGVRNRMARDLDYADYHDMAARSAELEGLETVVDDVLDSASTDHSSFRKEIDGEISKKLGVPKSRLVPWHFAGFWVEGAPGRKDPDVDRYLGDDPLGTARGLFTGIGLDIEPILAGGEVRSEATHGRSADVVLVDRDEGDARLRCVIGSDGDEFDRLVELLVRALAPRHMNPDLPWVLRDEPHEIVTGAVARVISRMARSPEHLASLGGPNKSTITRMTNRGAEHGRGRALLGMYLMCAVARFERAVYLDPGQDLERLWWENVRDVLRVGEPEDRRGHLDWATRLELTTQPLLNLREIVVELAAAQIEATLRAELDGPLWGNPDVGAILRERAFAHGASLDWRDAVHRLSGHPLNPEAWVASIRVETS